MQVLCLSGGTFRGAAHIGALRALTELGYKPDAVVGCSMGAVVGGMYAYGISLDAMAHELVNMNWRSLMDVNWKGLIGLLIPFWNPSFTGIFKGNRVEKKFRQMLKGKTEQIPFVAMVTDLVTGESIPLSGGDVAKNIRASMSLPGIFEPAIIDGRMVADGGINRAFPLDIAIEMGATEIVAVNAVDSIFDWDTPPKGLIESLERSMAIRGVEISKRQIDNARRILGDKLILIEPDLKPGSAINPKLIPSYIEQGYMEAINVLGGDAVGI